MNLLKDDVRRLFIKFLVPSVSSALAVAIYSLVDTIAIGQGVGPEGSAACALLLPVFSIASFIGLLTGVGGSVLMSMARGEGSRKTGDAYYTLSIAFAVVLTLAVSIAGFIFQKPFYRLFGADDVLLPYTYDYGRWIFAFMLSFVLNTVLGCFIRTDGSPRFVMAATLTGGAVNVFGDWFLVFPMGMGMNGAAIATVAGSVIQTLMLSGYILFRKTGLHTVRPSRWLNKTVRIFVSGCGAGVGGLSLIAVAYIANNQIMAYAGSTALAVYGVLGTVGALFTSIVSGIGQASQPIAAENFGAGLYDRCKRAGSFGMITAVIFGVIFSVLCIAFPVEVTGIFMKMTPDAEIITPYIMRVFSLAYIPQGAAVFAGYYLQSVDLPKKATLISLLRGIILICPFLVIFPLVWGGNGIWWAIFTAEMLTGAVSAVFMYRAYSNGKESNS